MKEFLLDFLKLLSNSILVICFAFASFLLIINFYHFEDVGYAYNYQVSDKKDYKDYKKTLKKVDKIMNSKSYGGTKYEMYGKMIVNRYNICISELNKGTYNEVASGNLLINSKVIYDSNNEILNEYHDSCLYSISSFISGANEVADFNHDFDSVNDVIKDKRKMVALNAEYLVNSGLGNSSYGFSTDIFKGTVYNKTINEFELTMNNYNMIASILEDVANWYALEFGGND